MKMRHRKGGLLYSATPEGKGYMSELSRAMMAYSRGEATESQLKLLAAVRVGLKDKTLDVAPRKLKGETMVISVWGKPISVNLEEYQRFQKSLNK